MKCNTNSTETELISFADKLTDIIWMHYFVECQGYDINKYVTFQDNMSALSLEKNGRMSLGCLFLQESSGFLCFPFLWHFFHRNHDSRSAITFSERHQETCLYGAYVESYVGYQFVRQKQSTIQFYGTLRWLLSTAIAALPPPLLRCHCCAATTTATPIAAPPLPFPLLRCLSCCCAAIAVAAPPKPLLRSLSHRCIAIAVAALPLPLLCCHRHCCTTTFSAIAAPIAAPPLLHRHNGDRRRQQWRRQWQQRSMTTATMKTMLTMMETTAMITMATMTRP
jgi:hypothetical protein